MQSLEFRVPRELAQVIVTWQWAVDWMVLKYQIETNGRARIISFKGNRDFTTIDTLPNVGEAVPWYGDIGGAYRYTFKPDGSDCLLTITNTIGEDTWFFPKLIPPLTLLVQKCLTIDMGDPYDGRSRWPSPQILEDRSDAEAAIKEMRFWIDDDMFAELQRAGWRENRAQGFSYTFVPTSVGCMIYVDNLEKNRRMELTRDVDW